MKNIWGIVLGALLVAGCHTSKRAVLYTLTEENDPVNTASLSFQYPEADGVYLFYTHTIAHDLKPDFKNNAPRWYFFESFHWKEAVLKDRIEEESVDFELAAYEALRDAHIRVIGQDGAEQIYGRRDLESERTSGDSTRYWLAGVALDEGATIEVAYEVERKELYERPPLSHDVAFQANRPIVQYTFDFTHPRDWDIQVKRVGVDRTVELAESRQEREETVTLRYTAERVPAFTARSYRPYLKEVAPYFHVQMRAFEVGNVLAYNAPEAWEHVADRYRPYAGAYSRKVAGPAAEAWEALSTEAGASEEARIAAIMAHLEDEISLSGHSDAAHVAKEGRGDAYAVTAYAKALLEAAGLTADYMIAHSAEGGYFDGDFVSSEQLYMPLLRVHRAGRPLYVFPALRGVPVGYVPTQYERQPALIFAEGAYEGMGEVPADHGSAYADRSDYQVYIDYDGTVRVEATLELGHYSAYLFNRRLRAAGEDRIESLTKALLPHDSSQVSSFVYRVERAGFDAPMRVRADYELGGCFDDLGDEFMLRSCGLFEPASASWHPFDPQRDTPMQLPADVSLERSVTVTYPSQWALVTDVAAMDESFARGRLVRAVKTDEGSVQVDQRLSLYRQVMQPAPLVATMASWNLPASAQLPFIEMSNSVWASMPALGPIEKGGPWTLVVGSYDTLEEAQKYADVYGKEVMKKGYRISILADEDETSAYRVVVGTFATRTSVETALHMLNEDIPYDTWMLGLKKPLTATTNGAEPVTH